MSAVKGVQGALGAPKMEQLLPDTVTQGRLCGNDRIGAEWGRLSLQSPHWQLAVV